MDPNSQQQPGQTISPGSNQGPQAEPPTNWKFNSQKTQPAVVSQTAQSPNIAGSNTITWSASEFVAHAKSASWYLILVLATLILAALVYLFTRDKISTSAVIVAALFFGIFAARKPRTLTYALDERGLKVGEKYYSLGQFKSFSLVQEGAFSGILLLPLKRFMPSLEIYYDPKDEDRITDMLSQSLPFEDKKLDPIDNFVKRIRF